MTERTPRGVPFETWVDRQIREASERGLFDDLPGAGKPLPGQGEPQDEMWWIKRKLEEENLRFPLPGSLALRREAEDALAAAARARSEAEVREIIAGINAKILDGTRKALSGPLVDGSGRLRAGDRPGLRRTAGTSASTGPVTRR
ncbi:DnaJ family domain-containing protein [Sphaerisporangium sp. NPDC004334]